MNRYHVQRYSNISIAAAGAADFPITAQLLQDPTLASLPPVINTPSGGALGSWARLSGFTQQVALENVALWIQPFSGNVNWKVQINGSDNAIATATTGFPLAKQVFTVTGVPAFDMVLNCNIANAGATPVIVNVWWVALIRNGLV